MTGTTASTECLSAETMAAFEARTMAQQDRVAVVEHLTACRRCRDAYFARQQRHDGRTRSHRSTVAALLAILFVAVASGVRPSAVVKGYEAVAQALGAASFRAVESRLSVSTEYQPLRRDGVEQVGVDGGAGGDL